MHLRKKKENSLACPILPENSNAIVSPIMSWPVQVVLSLHFPVSLCIPMQGLTQYSQQLNIVAEKYFAIVSDSIILKFVHI